MQCSAVQCCDPSIILPLSFQCFTVANCVNCTARGPFTADPRRFPSFQHIWYVNSGGGKVWTAFYAGPAQRRGGGAVVNSSALVLTRLEDCIVVYKEVKH